MDALLTEERADSGSVVVMNLTVFVYLLLNSSSTGCKSSFMSLSRLLFVCLFLILSNLILSLRFLWGFWSSYCLSKSYRWKLLELELAILFILFRSRLGNVCIMPWVATLETLETTDLLGSPCL